jgi:hypothetical protein
VKKRRLTANNIPPSNCLSLIACIAFAVHAIFTIVKTCLERRSMPAADPLRRRAIFAPHCPQALDISRRNLYLK